MTENEPHGCNVGIIKSRGISCGFTKCKNNIFTQVVGGRAPSDPSMTERMMLMSTYEEFMVILTTASLIVAILNMKNKK